MLVVAETALLRLVVLAVAVGQAALVLTVLLLLVETVEQVHPIVFLVHH
jgi:Tfp pilus assembly protein PilN